MMMFLSVLSVAMFFIFLALSGPQLKLVPVRAIKKRY